MHAVNFFNRVDERVMRTKNGWVSISDVSLNNMEFVSQMTFFFSSASALFRPLEEDGAFCEQNYVWSAR